MLRTTILIFGLFCAALLLGCSASQTNSNSTAANENKTGATKTTTPAVPISRTATHAPSTSRCLNNGATVGVSLRLTPTRRQLWPRLASRRRSRRARH